MKRFALIAGMATALAIAPNALRASAPQSGVAGDLTPSAGIAAGLSQTVAQAPATSSPPTGRSSDTNPIAPAGGQTTVPEPTKRDAAGISALGRTPADSGRPLGADCKQGLLGNRSTEDRAAGRQCSEQ